MDADITTQRRRIIAFVAVVLVYGSAVRTARAGVLVPAPAAETRGALSAQIQGIVRAADGVLAADNGVYEEMSCTQTDAAPAADALHRAALLSAILLIPPPVDLIADNADTQSDTTHAVVTSGPNQTIAQTGNNGGGQIVQAEGAPEPTSLMLGLMGSGLAGAGAWYRRRKSRKHPSAACGVAA